MSRLTRTTGRTRPARRRARTLGAVAVALLMASSLAACRPDQAGAAAVVGGDTISQSDLQGQARQVLEVLPEADPGAVQQGILQDMLLARVYDRMAGRFDLSVTDAEVARQRDQIFRQVRAAARQAKQSKRDYVVSQLAQGQRPAYVAPSQLEQWLRSQLLVRALQTKLTNAAEASKAFRVATRALQIEVNPRYGTWNPRTGVTPLVGGGLSKTVAELNAG